MQVQVDIAFEQLLKIVKRLPTAQLRQLRVEIDKGAENYHNKELERLLLKGPTATKTQLDTIKQNRKAISQWRTK